MDNDLSSLVILKERVLDALKFPDKVNKNIVLECYNIIYTHCTAHNKVYNINGEIIYKHLDDLLGHFCKNLKFSFNKEEFCKQSMQFCKAVEILEIIFSYLERFYIKISILKKNTGIKRIKELFFSNLYYNYIFNIENSLCDLIFLELETYRHNYESAILQLKDMIRFYIDTLVITNQSSNLEKFYLRYLDEFKNSLILDSEISKLLKKVYMELYFLNNFINEKIFYQEIVKFIYPRKSEIINYAFYRIMNFKKFKHIYKIMIMMPEEVLNEFKYKYEDCARSHIKKNLSGEATHENFCKFYQFYANIYDQIHSNCLVGFEDLLNELTNSVFNELPSESQFSHRKSMGLMLDSVIRNQELERFDIESYVELFNSIYNEKLVDFYTKLAQKRLLDGMSIATEEQLLEKLVTKMGTAMVGGLRSSINSFASQLSYNLEDLVDTNSLSDTLGLNDFNKSFTNTSNPVLTLVKVANAYWNIKPNNVKLNRSLLFLSESIYRNTNLEKKTVLQLNYKLSKITFKFKETRYSMASDTFSMLMHVKELSGKATLNELKDIVADDDFEYNYNFLIEHNFIILKEFLYFNYELENNEESVDYFNINYEKAQDTFEDELPAVLDYLVEMKICKILKRENKIEKNDLMNMVSESDKEFDRILGNLVDRGFLELENDIITYIP